MVNKTSPTRPGTDEWEKAATEQLPPGTWEIFSTSKQTPKNQRYPKKQPSQPQPQPPANQETTGKSNALRYILIVAAIIIAAHFVRNTDIELPGLETIRDLTQNRSEALETTENTLPIGSQPSNIQNPAQRHLELKQLMLRLTNQHRADTGVPTVRLGQNPAAQIHAEEALKGCYSAHWDRRGMKPNHRYTMTGGTGADAENGSGSSYCIQPDENYSPNRPMEEEVAKTVQGWMDSPGHRRTLLDPAHTVLNIGIAHDRFNTNMVQHFSSDYVSYQVRPNIDPQGVLRMEGQVSQATLEIGDSVNIQIGWDPPLKPLTQGQLANTYALCNPRQVGYVVESLPPNWFHRDPEIQTRTQEHPCVDPYRTSPSKPAPTSNDEAHQAWAKAKQASAEAPPITVRTRRITAEHMEISNNRFAVRTDLTPILQENGPGIYTITLWGRPKHMGEPIPLSKQSVFWQTEPTEDNPYRGTWGQNPAEIKQAQAMPTAPAQPVLQVSTPAPPINILQAPTREPVMLLPQGPTPVTLQASTPDPSIPVLLAATPIPPPDLSPTPTPNIHNGNLDQYSYNIEFPQGWSPGLEAAGGAVFISPDGAAGAEIRIRRLGSGGSTASLVERRNEELLERIRAAARTGTSDVYETKPHQPPPTTITDQLGQAWQIEYRWRESPDQCIRDVVDVISTSNRFTHSVLISAWVCEDSLDEEAETNRQEILSSFRGETIK